MGEIEAINAEPGVGSNAFVALYTHFRKNALGPRTIPG